LCQTATSLWFSNKANAFIIELHVLHGVQSFYMPVFHLDLIMRMVRIDKKKIIILHSALGQNSTIHENNCCFNKPAFTVHKSKAFGKHPQLYLKGGTKNTP